MTTTHERTAKRTADRTAAAGAVNVRTDRQRRRAAAKRRSDKRAAERTADTVRGWSLLTADNVRDMTAAGVGVGRLYLGTDAAELAAVALDRVARWIGRLDRERTPLAADRIERLAASRGPSGYAARLSRGAARQVVAKRGTGKGSMPRLVISDAEVNERLDAIYGVRSRSVAVGTADAAAVHNREYDAAELGPRVANAYWHTVLSVTPLAYRAITDAELVGIQRTAKYERTAAAPMYSRWLDAYGDTVPTASGGHTYAHAAPGVPTRDIAQLRRGSLRQRLAAVNTDAVTTAAAVLAMDAVSTRAVSKTGSIGRYPRRIPWTVIADAVNANVIPANLSRRVGAALELLADAELASGYVYAADRTASSQWSAVVGVPTGRYVASGRDRENGAPVVDRGTGLSDRRRTWVVDAASGLWVTPLADAAGIVRYNAAAIAAELDAIRNGGGDIWHYWNTWQHRASHGPLFQYGGGLAVAALHEYAERTPYPYRGPLAVLAAVITRTGNAATDTPGWSMPT